MPGRKLIVSHISCESTPSLAAARNHPYTAPFVLCLTATNARGTFVPVRGGMMLYYALVFLVVALIAGVLGVSGVAAVASNIAYVLFVIAIVLFLVHLLSGRRTIVP